MMFRGLLSNRYIQWMSFTNRPPIQPLFYVFWNFLGVQKWQKSISGSDKTKIFIYKVPFTFHPSVGLMHNSTTAKEKQKKD